MFIWQLKTNRKQEKFFICWQSLSNRLYISSHSEKDEPCQHHSRACQMVSSHQGKENYNWTANTPFVERHLLDTQIHLPMQGTEEALDTITESTDLHLAWHRITKRTQNFFRLDFPNCVFNYVVSKNKHGNSNNEICFKFGFFELSTHRSMFKHNVVFLVRCFT